MHSRWCGAYLGLSRLVVIDSHAHKCGFHGAMRIAIPLYPVQKDMSHALVRPSRKTLVSMQKLDSDMLPKYRVAHKGSKTGPFKPQVASYAQHADGTTLTLSQHTIISMLYFSTFLFHYNLSTNQVLLQ